MSSKYYQVRSHSPYIVHLLRQLCSFNVKANVSRSIKPLFLIVVNLESTLFKLRDSASAMPHMYVALAGSQNGSSQRNSTRAGLGPGPTFTGVMTSSLTTTPSRPMAGEMMDSLPQLDLVAKDVNN